MKSTPSPRRHHRLETNDTLVSGEMLTHAVDAISRRIRLDCDHDIPYLAGYSRDGRTIYIDRHLPKTFVCSGKRVAIDRFLILHEAVEKSLLDELGLRYQHAHQIALRAEEAAVRAAGLSWRQYDRFMQQFIKEAGDETLTRLPLDLDIKPYRDEHDRKLLLLMQQAMELERQQLAVLPPAVGRALRAARGWKKTTSVDFPKPPPKKKR
jgi:hypothetical protein